MKLNHVFSTLLKYNLDSKGFYMPVYVFKADINGNKNTIMVPAFN